MPDLFVIDRQAQHHSIGSYNNYSGLQLLDQPVAASLITSISNQQQQPADSNYSNPIVHQINQQQQQPYLTFECSISYDRAKDKNLIVKWHHDDRLEPIYQWIPELSKLSIAPQYRAFIVPLISQQQQQPTSRKSNERPSSNNSPQQQQHNVQAPSEPPMMSQEQQQTIEAGFRLVRPSKELGGE